MKKVIIAMSLLAALGAMVSFRLFAENLILEMQLDGYASYAAKLEARRRYDSGQNFRYEPVAEARHVVNRTNEGVIVKGYVVYSEADALFVKTFNARMAQLQKGGGGE